MENLFFFHKLIMTRIFKKKMTKIKKALKKVAETQKKIIDELCSLSTMLQEALDQEFKSTNLSISTTYKDTLVSHMNCNNCWNSLPTNLIMAKNVRVCTKKKKRNIPCHPEHPTY